MKKQKVKKRKRVNRKVGSEKPLSNLEILDQLIRDFVQQRQRRMKRVGVGDVLKAIKLSEKLRPQSEGEKVLWGLVDELRTEELGKKQSVEIVEK